MREVIDTDVVKLQIESSRESTWVPDGLCYPKGSRTKPVYFEESTEKLTITKVGNHTMSTASDISAGTKSPVIPNWTSAAPVSDWGYWDAANHRIVITRPVYLAIYHSYLIDWVVLAKRQEGGTVGTRKLPSASVDPNSLEGRVSYTLTTGEITGGDSQAGYQYADLDFGPSFTRLTGLLQPGEVIYPTGVIQWYASTWLSNPDSVFLAGSTIEFMEYDGEEYFKVIPQHYVSSGSNSKPTPSASGSFGATTTFVKEGAAKVAEFMPNTETVTTQQTVIVEETVFTGGEFVTVVRETQQTVISDYLTALKLSRAVEGGPTILQTRLPVPVNPGDRVNFAGRWQVSRTGIAQATDFGTRTGLDLRTSLWGVGWFPDEYGVEKMQAVELMFYQAPLQTETKVQGSVDYIFPTLPDATVPDNVLAVHLTFSYVETSTGQYATGTQTYTNQSGNNDSRGPNMARGKSLFHWNPSYHFPFAILVEPAEGYYTMEHSLLETKAGFESRKFFKNVRPGAEMIVAGPPGEAASFSVYNYSGSTRGSLIGSYTINADEVLSVILNPSTSAEGIEVVSTSQLFIQSVLNDVEIDTETSYQNRIQKLTFSDVSSDVSKMSILREEGEMGSLTIDFCSSDLDPRDSQLLRVGKKMRLISYHWGDDGNGPKEYETIFFGSIRKVSSEYDYMEDDAIIQVVVYDEGFELENIKDIPAFTSWTEYGPMVSKLGIDVLHNGFNWGGARQAMEHKLLYTPSPLGDDFMGAMNLTRNTIKGHWYINKKNQLILLDESPTIPLVELSDDRNAVLSYGGIKMTQDSNTTINTLKVVEHSVDYDDYMGRTIDKGSAPPSDFQYPSSRQRTATFKREQSIEDHGELEQTIHVIRATGDIKDLWEDEYGPGFNVWAQGILDAYENPVPDIKEITVPVKSRTDLYYISQIDLLTPLVIHYQGRVFNVKVKSIDMEIRPGRWTCVLQFDSKNDRSYW